jgi:catecholate siderophore receptor
MQTKVPQLPNAGSATLTYGAANQRRATADVNRAFNFGRRDGWLSKSAVRMNVLWQDSGIPGRDEVENESKAVAPSIGLGLGTATRVLASAQILRQNNVPDYGIPGAAWHESLLAPTTQHSAREVDQSNYYGSPAYDSDKAHQNTVTLRIEHDFRSRWSLSNQTRYNRTTREAIISTIQNVAAYVPETELVTIARQGNIRENQITSNQTSLTGRVTAGGLEHNISSGLELARESQFAPALAGLGTRDPVNIYAPNPYDPVTGFAPVRSGTYTDGATNTVASYAFDSLSLGTRVQVNAGLRGEHYRTEFFSFTAPDTVAADLSGSGTILSGKAGVVFRLKPNANVYAAYGTTVTPPGGANFTLSPVINNQNNPNVEPQRSSNLEAGVKWEVASGRLSLNASVFHTINENVLFTVDAGAIPPVFNQDDKQRVDGVTLGATGQITPAWAVLASFGYLDTESLSQNSANDGRRLTLSPKYSGSAWMTYKLPRKFTVGGGVRATSEVFINAGNTINAPGYGVLDGLVEYAVNQYLTLRLNIHNVTDAVYIRNVNNNGGRYNPGHPRTAQITTAITF